MKESNSTRRRHPHRALALFFLLSLPTINQAQSEEVQCPGFSTLEIRQCASQQLEHSSRTLQNKLPSDVLKAWNKAKRDVCAAAYAPYREGSIYPQMVTGCSDRLNRALIKEFEALSSPTRAIIE